MTELFHTCLLCKKDNLNLFKRHLRSSHAGLSIEEYFRICNISKHDYQKIEDSLKAKRAKNSPSSLTFWQETKGLSVDESRIALGKFQQNMRKSCSGDSKYPHQIQYWIKKGNSIEQAEENVKKFKFKLSHTVEGYLESGFSAEDAEIKRKNFMDSLAIRKDTELKNLINEYECSYEEAYALFCGRRATSNGITGNSIRHVKYWTDRGFSAEDAKVKVKDIYSRWCKWSVDYWINNHGMSFEEARIEVKKNIGVRTPAAIAKKFEITAFEGEEIWESWTLSNHKTFKVTDLNNENRKRLYYDTVWKVTLDTIKRHPYKIENSQMRGKDFHLDHKFSIIAGFTAGIDPWIMGQFYNLVIIPAKDNLKKGANCSIMLEELLHKAKENI